MKNSKLNSNKMLFMLLFAALSLDLAGRIQKTNGSMNSSDLASQAETDCAGMIKGGIGAGNKEAGCTLNFKEATTEARVRKVPKGTGAVAGSATGSLDSWETPKAQTAAVPAPVSMDEPMDMPAKPNLDKCVPSKKDKKATQTRKMAACKKANADKQKSYDSEVVKVQAYNAKIAHQRTKAAPQAFVEEEFEIELNAEGIDCADCRDTVTFSAAKTTSPIQLAKMIRAKADEQIKRMAKAKSDLLAKAKLEEAERKKAEKLAKDQEACKVDGEGKALTGRARLECDTDKLSGLEGEEARARYANVESALEQMIKTGSEEDRRYALSKVNDIAKNSSLPREVRDTSYVMYKAGKYQSQIMTISEQLVKLPQGSMARYSLMSRLSNLGQQMQYDLGSTSLRSQRGHDSLMEWSGTLQSSLSMAIYSPQSLTGSGTLNMDINQYSRTLRGLPGDPLLSNQGGFNSLQLTGNTAVDFALRQQYALTNGTNTAAGGQRIPGIPGTVVSSQRSLGNQFGNNVLGAQPFTGVQNTSLGINSGIQPLPQLGNGVNTMNSNIGLRSTGTTPVPGSTSNAIRTGSRL